MKLDRSTVQEAQRVVPFVTSWLRLQKHTEKINRRNLI